MKAWGLTDIGNIREINQDTFRVEHDPGTDSTLVLVCDGMGGTNAGEVASDLASNAFIQVSKGGWHQAPPCELSDWLHHVYDQVNEVVFDASNANPSYSGMGTTMVTAICRCNEVLFGNVGDSRGYLLDETGMQQITEDHSLVTDLVKRGDLTPYQASRHPSRNVITRAMGAEPTVKSDTFLKKVKKGDFLLLCSDGLIHEVTEPEIYYEVFQTPHPETACERLIELAKNRGGRDNITVVLVAF